VNYSNWGDWEQLDGKTLVDGEALRVTWPDGSTLDALVKVVDHGQAISDHGSSYTGSRVRAYVEIDYRGVRALVPIRGLEAERRLHETTAGER
jgi:hypothetical protein